MPGIPQFDRASLARLRRLMTRLARKQTRMPMRDLVALGSEALPGQWRIDLDASQTLGMPLLLHAGGPSPALARLGRREREVAALIADGLSNKIIADRLGLTVGTVKDYVHRVLVKTGLSNRAAIAAAVSGR